MNRKTNVISDHVIEVFNCGETLRLRRIGYRDQETKKLLGFFDQLLSTFGENHRLYLQNALEYRAIRKKSKQNLRNNFCQQPGKHNYDPKLHGADSLSAPCKPEIPELPQFVRAENFQLIQINLLAPLLCRVVESAKKKN